MLTYTDSDCEQLMQKIDGKLDGLLQFWRTDNDWLQHVANVGGDTFYQPHKVLDLGCGNGQFLHAYKMVYPEAECEGFNIFGSQIARCRDWTLELQYGDITKSEMWPSSLYQKIFCHYTLGHIEDTEWEQLFDAVFDHLEPGGEFIIWDICQKHVERDELYGYRLYPLCEVFRVLKESGFSVTFNAGHPTWYLHEDLFHLLDRTEIDLIRRYTCPVLFVAERMCNGNSV